MTTINVSIGGTLSFVGNNLIRVNKIASGALSCSGALIKKVNSILTGSLSSSGSIIKIVYIPLKGVLSSFGIPFRLTSKHITGSLSLRGRFENFIYRILPFMNSKIRTYVMPLDGIEKEYQITTKDSNDTLDYPIDYNDWLKDINDTYSYHVITVTGGLIHTLSDYADGVVTIWLSGGTVGDTATFSIRTTTIAGRVSDKTFYLIIREK